MDIQAYLEAVKDKLLLCPKISSIEIIDERVALQSHAYFRARLILINGDFLEISEYVISDGEQCRTQKYRYQWMDKSQTRLIRRWDNVGHFPDISSYPHHVHIGTEDNVFASESLNIIELIEIVVRECA
jgi:hypothetical protein